MNDLHPDPWLAEVLGWSVFRVDLEFMVERLWTELEKIPGRVFAYAKLPAHEITRVHELEAVRFRLVDTNVVFEKPRSTPATVSRNAVRSALADDEDPVTLLASTVFRYSRFHLDPHFPRDMAERIKSEWARSYFRGTRGQEMLVAESAGEVVGFNQLLHGASTVTTDLIAVDPRHQRRGIGADLLLAAERRFPDASTFRVGTQIANAPSMRLYESLGYRMTQAQYVLHYHRE